MYLNKKEKSSFLMYRMINPMQNRTIAELFPNRVPIRTSEELENHLKSRVEQICCEGAALALSGGIDSAVLAKFMPKGSLAYTFRCIVPGVEVTDETLSAARFAEACGLQHKVINIYWEDCEQYAPILMKHKKAPIHSIEVQIYKASLQAKTDGISTIIFGEAADAVYGGLSGLLSRDWPIGEFVDRYSFVRPYYALKNFELVMEPYEKWAVDGVVDPHKFVSNIFINESVGSYINATETAGINIGLPYPESYLFGPIDYDRIRRGDNKYLIRDIFERLYPNFIVPPKTPMPRPVAEWLKDWGGPKRDEFWPHCADNMTGDQKWLLWSLEKYLDL